MTIIRRAYQRTRAHWWVIASALVLVSACFLIVRPDLWGFSIGLVLLAIFTLLCASQIFWVGRLVGLAQCFLPGKPRRGWLSLVAALLYVFFFIYSFPSLEETTFHVFRAADWRLSSMVIEATYWWWLVGSLAGFILVVAFGVVDWAVRGVVWVFGGARKFVTPQIVASRPVPSGSDPALASRRHFLEQAAVALSATPFVAAGYGLLYERLDIEITHRRIRLSRLPQAFEGFRIAQLSDVHISPFMNANQIRRCVAMTNGTKPDLIAMTGDYITWDAEAQRDVVEALAGLRAPFGVFGCLGNHEQESATEGSITRLFAAKGIRILRQESALIRLRGESLNVIGVDEPRSESDVFRKLQQIKELMMPDTVNILLTHFPGAIHHVSGLGVDLTLTGHTHGGQLSLEFIHRGLSLAHLLSPYDSGWYEENGCQLYVNRGLGTTGFPIRIGARPEITVFELVRGV
jgi:predicted MPP superfamily phosphohydrolase